jgi:putative nucleotidyltransferase with HDIG domain
MDRQTAMNLLQENLKNKNLFKHCLALEAVMRKLADHPAIGGDEETWGLAGLLHDLDYEETLTDPQKHTLITAKKLKETGVPEEIISIIKAHNSEALGLTRETKADKAIYAADPLTGLIVAAALIHPDKKLNSIDTKFVLNRFKEGGFARGSNREQIKTCSDLGLSLEEFVSLGLQAMQEIASELGLA